MMIIVELTYTLFTLQLSKQYKKRKMSWVKIILDLGIGQRRVFFI